LIIEYEIDVVLFGGLKRSQMNMSSRCMSLTKDESLIRNEKGGPLVEESLLLGLAVVTVSIVIAVILQATGWAQDVVEGLLQLLQDSWSSLTQLFGAP
jgi:hypothetical protein